MLKTADEHDDRSPEASPRPDPSSDDARAPQVAVVYRSRGVPWWLIPPLLLVAAVVGVVSYRRIEPTRPRVVYVKETPTIAAAAAAPLASPEVVATVASAEPSAFPSPPSVIPAPVSTPVSPATPAAPLRVEPTPAPTGPSAPVYEEPILAGPEPSADPVPDPVPPPRTAAPRSAVGFDPDALKIASETPAPPQNPPPPPGSGDAPGRAGAFADDNRPPIDDIQAEAKRIALERRRMAALKRSVAKPNPYLDRKLRDQRISLARKDAESRRKPFLDELRELAKTNDVRVVPEILALCERSGRETAPELLDAAFGELSGPASHLSSKGKIERLRVWGVPEPIILDHVIDTESGDVGGRNGPRNHAILTLRAARQLLAIPLAAPTAKAAPRAAAPSSASTR